MIEILSLNIFILKQKSSFKLHVHVQVVQKSIYLITIFASS